MLLPVGVKFPEVSKDRWRPGSNPRSVHVGFVVDKLRCYRFFSEYFGFLLSLSYLFICHRFFPCHCHIYSSVTDAMYCRHISDTVVKQESKDLTACIVSADSAYVFDTLIFLRSLVWPVTITVPIFCTGTILTMLYRKLQKILNFYSFFCGILGATKSALPESL